MSYESDAGYVPDSASFAIFFLLKAGEPADWVRLWSGDGDFHLEADATDTAGGLYMSLGFPIQMPELSMVINGAYGNFDISLPGIDMTALRLLNADREIVDGAQLHFGIMDLDGTQQPVGPVDWLMDGTAGKPRASRQGQGEGAVFAVTLPFSTALYDRNRSIFEYWTPASQRKRSADDAFCDLVPKMSAGMVVGWPS